MRVALIILFAAGLIFSLADLARAQALSSAPLQDALNLDFESGQAGTAPSGWQFAGMSGAEAIAKPDAAHAGALGVEVTIPASDDAPASASLSQTVDARRFRGRRLRFSVIAANVGGASGGYFWVDVLDAHQRKLETSNTLAHPILAPDWTSYDAPIRVAPDAVSITFGYRMQNRRGGRVRIDDIAIQDVGGFNDGNAAPRALSDQGLANLTALARLYGYVRYFHPSDEAAAANWDVLLRAGVEHVEGARSSSDLVKDLRDVFLPVAPSLNIELESVAAPNFPALAGERVAWVHFGLGGGQWQGVPTPFSSQRTSNVGGIPERVRLDLPRGLVAWTPLVVQRDGAGHTLPQPTAIALEPRAMPIDWTPSGDDRSSRLVAIIEAWNLPQHFAPNLATQQVDWGSALDEGLREAATNRDTKHFDISLRRLADALNDGHGGITRGNTPALMPFAWAWVEGRVVVTGLNAASGPLSIGDVVLAIDGRSIDDLLSKAGPPWGGATQAQRRDNALAFDIMTGGVGESANLRIDHGGRIFSARVALTPFDNAPSAPRQPIIDEMQPGVLYVDLTRLSDQDLAQNLDKMAAARAIVFDVRGYPTSTARQVLQHLSDQNIGSDQFNTPIYSQPDQHGVVYHRDAWSLAPVPPRFRGVFVFMTDVRATSYGEALMSAVETSHLGAIVGTPTSGTDGNINSMPLVTGHAFNWTGMEVLRADGARRFGVGVVPNVEAHPTIAGVRAGRDEVLEIAIRMAQAQAQARVSSDNAPLLH